MGSVQFSFLQDISRLPLVVVLYFVMTFLFLSIYIALACVTICLNTSSSEALLNFYHL